MRNLAAMLTIATVLPLTAASAATLSKTDSSFIMKAAQGGMTEVMEGQAATATASSADVKTFAQKMIDAHTANNQDLMTLASSKGVDVPTTLDKKHQKQVDMLSKKTGSAFDTAYLKDQTKDHEAMEKVMQDEISNGTDADVKAFATKTLPVVQDHLGMVKAIKA